MKEIVIISGKGGTGKTSVTASFAFLGGSDVIIADCDVDAADMHLLLNPDFAVSNDFYSGELAQIDVEKCIGCGLCYEVCRFNAISLNGQHYIINPLNCEGCGYCARVCPVNAITNIIPKAGQWFVSKIKTGSTMVHARLGIGADNSGKLVSKVKTEAKEIAEHESKNIILVDGAPGIGCPVVSSLAGANLVILVTEPTVSGIHDLKRVYEVVKKFGIHAQCIINKADINVSVSKTIKEYLEIENIPLLAEIPYDIVFTQAMTLGKTVVECDQGKAGQILRDSWERIWGSER